MFKIKDNAHYEDTLKELKAHEYNSYDDLPDELEDMRNQLIEFLERRKKYVDEREKAIAEYKIEIGES